MGARSDRRTTVLAGLALLLLAAAPACSQDVTPVPIDQPIFAIPPATAGDVPASTPLVKIGPLRRMRFELEGGVYRIFSGSYLASTGGSIERAQLQGGRAGGPAIPWDQLTALIVKGQASLPEGFSLDVSSTPTVTLVGAPLPAEEPWRAAGRIPAIISLKPNAAGTELFGHAVRILQKTESVPGKSDIVFQTIAVTANRANTASSFVESIDVRDLEWHVDPPAIDCSPLTVSRTCPLVGCSSEKTFDMRPSLISMGLCILGSAEPQTFESSPIVGQVVCSTDDGCTRVYDMVHHLKATTELAFLGSGPTCQLVFPVPVMVAFKEASTVTFVEVSTTCKPPDDPPEIVTISPGDVTFTCTGDVSPSVALSATATDKQDPPEALKFRWTVSSSGERPPPSFAPSDQSTMELKDLTPGIYSANLVVTDTTGLTDTKNLTITVVNALPSLKVKLTDKTRAGEELKDADEYVLIGEKLTIDARDSTDCENDRDKIPLTYEWRLKTTSGETVSADSSITTSPTADLEVTVKIMDADGGSTTKTFGLKAADEVDRSAQAQSLDAASNPSDASQINPGPARIDAAGMMSGAVVYLRSIIRKLAGDKSCGAGSGPDPVPSLAGDPIDMLSGRVVEHADCIGWSTPAGPLVFARTYNPSLRDVGMLGRKWSHTFERRIRQLGTLGFAEVDGRGVQILYRRKSNRELESPIPGGPRIESTPGGWVTRYPTGETYRYGPDNELRSIEDGYGNKILVERGPDKTEIIDAAGKRLVLEHDAHGRIAAVRAKDGQRIQFAYNVNGYLAAETDATGQIKTYEYTPGGLITRITLPSSECVDYTYVDERVTEIKTTSASGRIATTRIEYEPGARTLTDPEGRKTVYRYDDSGRLVAQEHGGERYAMTYAPSGQLQSVTRPDGRIEKWAYDDSGRMVSFTTANGETTQVEYTGAGRIPVARVRPDGGREVFEFDHAGNFVRQADPRGRVTTYERNALGQVTAIVDPAGVGSELTYTADGDVLHVKDGIGRQTTFTRDGLGRAIEVASPSGRRILTEYRGLGQVTAITDASGQRTTIEYDSVSRPTAVVRPSGARIETSYEKVNGIDVITATKDAAGHIWKAIYDDAGVLMRQEDPLGRITTFTINAQSRVSKITHPDQSATTLAYTRTGQVSEIKNARGAATRFFYDPNLRLSRIERADGSVTSIQRDEQGRVTAMTSPDGATRRTIYDNADQVLASIDALGGVWRREYNAVGLPTRVLDASDRATRILYDQTHRVSATIDALGFERSMRRGADDEVTSSTNARGFITSFGYDALLRLVETVDPAGHRLTFERDVVGNVTRIVNENRKAWSIAYDLLDRPVAETDPRGHTTRRTYNPAGELIRVDFADSTRFELVYDLRGRLIERRHVRADESIEDVDRFTYDAVGNRLSAENNAVRIESQYDIMDREVVRNITYRSTGATRTLRTTFDTVGRPQRVTDTHGRVSAYKYDLEGRPTELSVTEPDPMAVALPAAFKTRVFKWSWDRVGNPTEAAYPNGIRTTRTYDAGDRLTKLVHEQISADAAQILSSFTYQRDREGNITQSVNERGETWRYDYSSRDELVRTLLPKELVNRLTKGDKGTKSKKPKDKDLKAELKALGAAEIRYSYDPAGNRIAELIGGKSIASAFDDANQILSRGSTAYRHDVRGRLIEKVSADGTRHQFDFNIADRLTRFLGTQPAALPAEESYNYATTGERVDSRSSAGTTHFLWRGLQIAEEWSPQQSVEVGTLNVSDLAGQLFERAPYSRVNGVTQLSGGLKSLSWLTPDYLTSTSSVVDSTGRERDRLSYGPWGEELEGKFDEHRITYAGTQREASSGLQLMLHRWYDPEIGRFISRDPIGFAGGDLNLYRYVSNNPVNARDPLGLYGPALPLGYAFFMSPAGVAVGLAGLAAAGAFALYGEYSAIRDVKEGYDQALTGQTPYQVLTGGFRGASGAYSLGASVTASIAQRGAIGYANRNRIIKFGLTPRARGGGDVGCPGKAVDISDIFDDEAWNVLPQAEKHGVMLGEMKMIRQNAAFRRLQGVEPGHVYGVTNPDGTMDHIVMEMDSVVPTVRHAQNNLTRPQFERYLENYDAGPEEINPFFVLFGLGRK